MSDSTIYIVAGGPSLRGYDWYKLKDRRVIAVNRSYEMLPWAEVIYFSDLRFFEWHREALLAHKGRKITGSRLEHPKVERYRLTGQKGLDLTPGCLRSGNNSGYAAINLAVHLGARSIMLLGFDMCFDKSGTHWHDGYTVLNRERQFSKMLPFFDSLPPYLKTIGVTVVNACIDSRLDVFEKIPLEAVA